MLIVKAPIINGLGKTEGCKKAPDKILETLKEIYSNENGKIIEGEKIKINDVNIDRDNLEESYANLSKKAKEVFSANDSAVFLGGDHSITFPIVNEFAKKFNRPGVIIFDAHADCMHDFKPATHEDLLRALISSGFPVANIILVGLRSVYADEKEFLQKHKINTFSMKELFDNLRKSCDLIMENARKFENVYVSIDIDVIDPAFAPGTGYAEPAGLTSREFLYLIQRLKRLNNLKAFDIVEINPEKDVNGMTVKLGAKILGELI